MSKNKNHFAAIDLGSNSFHLIVVEHTHQQISTIDSHVETIRLAAGLDKDGRLSKKYKKRAYKSLMLFRQRLQTVPTKNIRIVGTATLRKMKKGQKFVKTASKILGHEVEIISGYEEARLVYLGVAHSLQDDSSKRLVIDIGGSSTELIVGGHFQHQSLDSLDMGCINISRHFFPDKKISQEGFHKAVQFCESKLLSVRAKINSLNWDTCIGSSGTIKAVVQIISALNGHLIPVGIKDLDKLKQEIFKFDKFKDIDLPGLKPDRKPVILGGLAILYACFKSLKIDSIQSSQYALREGLVYEMVGRNSQEDVRESTVSGMIKKYSQDKLQILRVETACEYFYEQTKMDWNYHFLNFNPLKILKWAAKLHEIGNSISHKNMHKHSSYIIRNMDMAGFSKTEQLILSHLVLHQKKAIGRSLYKELAFIDNLEAIFRLQIILRFAVIIYRDRYDHQLPKIAVNENEVNLIFDSNWIEKHHLTSLDIDREVRYLDRIGYDLIKLEKLD